MPTTQSAIRPTGARHASPIAEVAELQAPVSRANDAQHKYQIGKVAGDQS